MISISMGGFNSPRDSKFSSIEESSIVPVKDRTGSAKITLGDRTLSLESDLLVVLGLTGSGKSTLGKDIASQLGESITLLNFVETVDPGEIMITDPNVLLDKIRTWLMDDDGPMVMEVDSFRYFVYINNTKANTGKGGINMGLFTDLTSLQYIAQQRGKVLIITLNPGELEEEAYESLANNLAAGITTISFEYRDDYLNGFKGQRIIKISDRAGNRDWQTATLPIMTPIISIPSSTLNSDESDRTIKIDVESTPKLEASKRHSSSSDMSNIIKKLHK